MAEATRAAAERLSEALVAAGHPYRLAVVDTADLELLEKNARYMTSETFRQLVDNVKRDGALSSLPFCWKRGDRYRVLSGNHRVQAARSAGVQEVLVLYTDADLTRDQEVAIQLSHNAIVGQDDPELLADLWAEIRDVEAKAYSGLDDALLDAMMRADLPPLSEARLGFRTVTFLMLPEEEERLRKAIEAARRLMKASGSTVLGRFADFDRLLDSLDAIHQRFNVVNGATAIGLMLDAFEASLAHGQAEGGADVS